MEMKLLLLSLVRAQIALDALRDLITSQCASECAFVPDGETDPTFYEAYVSDGDKECNEKAGQKCSCFGSVYYGPKMYGDYEIKSVLDMDYYYPYNYLVKNGV